MRVCSCGILGFHGKTFRRKKKKKRNSAEKMVTQSAPSFRCIYLRVPASSLYFLQPVEVKTPTLTRRLLRAIRPSGAAEMSTTADDLATCRRAPPVAKKVEHRMELFGDVRIDNYYWLRDDSRSDPDVLAYLRQENEYTDSVMSGAVFDPFGFSGFVAFSLLISLE